MEKVRSAAQVGGVVRRLREDAGLSRAALAGKAGVSPRTLFSFENGEADNVGLGRVLDLLSAAGVQVWLSVGDGDSPAQHQGAPAPLRYSLGEMWRLD